MRVYLRFTDALGRAITRAAEIVMGQVVSGSNDLRNTEIEQPHFAVRTDLDIGRLDVPVNDGCLTPV